MGLRTPLIIRIFFDVTILILLGGLLIGLGLYAAAQVNDTVREKLKPLNGIACKKLDPGPAKTSTRLVDLLGDWQGMGAKSLAGATLDAFRNEADAFCVGDDLSRKAFLAAAEKMSAAAKTKLRNAPPPGLYSEDELFRIESAQIARQKPEHQELARWAIAETNRLLARPEKDIVADIKEQTGLNAAGSEADRVVREIAATGLLDALGGNELISRIEDEVQSKISPPKITLTRTAFIEPEPALEITGKSPTIIGLPVTIIAKDVTGTYKATRVWLTLEAKGTKLLRWITRPI